MATPREIVLAERLGEERGLEFAARLAEACADNKCSPAGLMQLICHRLCHVREALATDAAQDQQGGGACHPPVSSPSPAGCPMPAATSGAADGSPAFPPGEHRADSTPAGGPEGAGAFRDALAACVAAMNRAEDECLEHADLCDDGGRWWREPLERANRLLGLRGWREGA